MRFESIRKSWASRSSAAALLGCTAFGVSPGLATTPPVLTLAKPADQARFRVTTFATGLSFPSSLAQLADGSLLVGTSNGPSLWTTTSGSLLRLVDSNGDGIADGPPSVLAAGLPALVTSVRRVDDLVLALSSASGHETLSLLRTGVSAADPLTPAGSLSFSFPTGFEHNTYSLAARRSPSNPAALEVFFNIGSKYNDISSAETVGLQGDGSKVILPLVQMASQSIQRLTLTPAGSGFTATVQQIASGLRNAGGLIFSPSGDLYFEDNGIDTPSNPDISLSADELNRIAAADLGVSVPSFGFPDTYISYEIGRAHV